MLALADIERDARTLLGEMERHSGEIWSGTPPARIYMCDPEAACRFLGLKYLPDSHLGQYGGTATAGMLDRERRAVLLSSKQSFEAMRFTAAHEIGHWRLHPGQQFFRDRTLAGPGTAGRSQIEVEADKFAASFLAPPKLLRDEFLARFLQRLPLTNTGVICFNLSSRNHQYLEGLPRGSLEFAIAVARAEIFAGRPFRSLAHLFGMSTMAMGLRLLELGFVE